MVNWIKHQHWWKGLYQPLGDSCYRQRNQEMKIFLKCEIDLLTHLFKLWCFLITCTVKFSLSHSLQGSTLSGPCLPTPLSPTHFIPTMWPYCVVSSTWSWCLSLLLGVCLLQIFSWASSCYSGLSPGPLPSESKGAPILSLLIIFILLLVCVTVTVSLFLYILEGILSILFPAVFSSLSRIPGP